MAREQIQIDLTASDKASPKLEKVADEARRLDGETVRLDVEADTSAAEGNLDKLKNLGGDISSGFGDVAGMLGPAGGIAAGGAALVGILTGLSGQVGQAAFDAQGMADAFGASIEEASRLQKAVAKAGIETGDLFDIVSQVTGALSDQPDLMKELGIAAGPPLRMFRDTVRAVQEIEDPTRKALLASQLFGEEGQRQIAGLIARYGSLDAAIQSVDQSLVSTTADLEAAKEGAQNVDELKNSFNELTTAVGRAFTPVLNTATGALASLVDEEERGLSAAQRLAIRIGTYSEAVALGTTKTAELEGNLQLAKQAMDTAFTPAVGRGGDAVQGLTEDVETLNETPPRVTFDWLQLEADALRADAILREKIGKGIEVPIFLQDIPGRDVARVRRQLEALSAPFRLTAQGGIPTAAVSEAQRRNTYRNGAP